MVGDRNGDVPAPSVPISQSSVVIRLTQELRVFVRANRGSLNMWIRTTSKNFAEMLAQCSKTWLPYVLVSGSRKFHLILVSPSHCRQAAASSHVSIRLAGSGASINHLLL